MGVPLLQGTTFPPEITLPKGSNIQGYQAAYGSCANALQDVETIAGEEDPISCNFRAISTPVTITLTNRGIRSVTVHSQPRRMNGLRGWHTWSLGESCEAVP
jgi:hypothetical protein